MNVSHRLVQIPHPVLTILSCRQQDSPIIDVVHTEIFMPSLSRYLLLSFKQIYLGRAREKGPKKTRFKQVSASGNLQSV